MFTGCHVLYCTCMHPSSIHPSMLSIHHPSLHPSFHAAIINSLSHLSAHWSSHLSFHLLCTKSPVLKHTLHVTTLQCNQRKLAFSFVKIILISFVLNCFIFKTGIYVHLQIKICLHSPSSPPPQGSLTVVGSMSFRYLCLFTDTQHAHTHVNKCVYIITESHNIVTLSFFTQQPVLKVLSNVSTHRPGSAVSLAATICSQSPSAELYTVSTVSFL